MTRMKWGNEGGSGSHIINTRKKKKRRKKMPNVSVRRITLKHNGTCARCDGVIGRGQVAYWSRGTKAVAHVECYERNRK